MPCNSVHTFGMRYAIDVIFLDKKNRVIRMVQELRPNRLSPVVWKARSVLELPASYLRELSLAVNDKLELA